MAPPKLPLPDGIVAFVKKDCPTCVTVAPVLAQIAERAQFSVFTQDDLAFPEGLDPRDDTSLDYSWHHEIETVPTLIRVEGGVEHVGADNMNFARHYIADWFAETLGGHTA